jgi:hypothetical protein
MADRNPFKSSHQLSDLHNRANPGRQILMSQVATWAKSAVNQAEINIFLRHRRSKDA